jgi:Tol biopolymer transport system component
MNTKAAVRKVAGVVAVGAVLVLAGGAGGAGDAASAASGPSLVRIASASEGASQLKLSPDGKYAVFVSAQPLTSAATNNYQQVYLRNLQTGATTLISVGPDGQAGNANSSGGQFAGAAISADDRYVAFTSAASNLVPGGTSGGVNNVFVRDLAAGTTSLVSVHLAGVTGNNGAYGSGGPVISADGQYVAFSSDASDLVPNDPHQPNMDVFLRDMSTGTTTQVTTTGTYGPAMYGYTGSFANAITPDGQYVLFTSNASGLVPGYGGGAHDVYLWQQGTSTPKLVSLGIDGRSSRTGTPDANGSLGTAISADGRYAAFDSDAVNMVAGNTYNNTNVYVRDLLTSTTMLVSAEPGGSPPPDGSSNQSSMSADGRYVAFESTSQLLGPTVPSTPAYHIYLRDLQSGTISLADVSAAGQVGNGSSPMPAYPSLSADGQSVAFTSNATNLLPGSAVGDWLLSAAAAAPPTAPAVTGISPASGPAAGGTAVTVTGSNLTGGTVAFGSTAATGVSCSASSCTATSPAGTGTVNVTVTTAGGASATSSADQFTYTAAPPPNLIPNPGFESPGVPSDHWGSRLARSTAVVHSGSWALAQTTRSSSGGWDLDSDSNWYAPISPAHSYTVGIWVRSSATVRVNLNLDLLDSSGNYVGSASGATVTLAAGTWTHLTITGIKPAAGEVYAGIEPNFSRAASGTVIYWDDMSLTSP